MFKFMAKRKFSKTLSKIMALGESDTWEEGKALHVEGMILACMVDYGSYRDPQWACLQALETVKARREQYLIGMPFEYYADLVVTIKNKVSRLPQDYKDTAATLERLATTLEW